jgi:hypothetical protein
MSDRILAAEALESASLIVRARKETHGKPCETHDHIAKLWNAYLSAGGFAGKPLNGSDVAYMMLLLKIGRQFNAPYNADSILDVVGYAAIAAEVKSGEHL